MSVTAFISQLPYRNRIRNRREELRMSQEDLAVHMEKSQGYISAVERGCYDVRIGTALEFAQALRIDLFDLFIVPKKRGPKEKAKNER